MTLLDSYVYETQLEWTGGRSARVSSEGLPELDVSAPLEFSGEPGVWTPEHLVVAATASCLMTTFLAIAEMSKLSVASYESKAIARLQKVPEEGYRFTEIKLMPQIGVAEEDREKAQKILAKAEKNCFISNSLRATVQVEPKILIALPTGVE
jgi:peroxiredoxin-like protein